MIEKHKILLFIRILEYSVIELLKGGEIFYKLDYKSVKKNCNNLIIRLKKDLSSEDRIKFNNKLLSINKINCLERLSHEIFIILLLDWLVNIEKDKSCRQMFSYLDLSSPIDLIYSKYPNEVKSHNKYLEDMILEIKR